MLKSIYFNWCSCSNLEEFGLLTYPPTKLSQLSHLYLQNLLQPIYANLLGMDTFCLPNAETDISDDYVELFYDLSLVGLYKWFKITTRRENFSLIGAEFIDLSQLWSILRAKLPPSPLQKKKVGIFWSIGNAFVFHIGKIGNN